MSIYIVRSKNISKAITFLFCLLLVSCFLNFAPSALASLQSTTYQIIDYSFGSGGTATTSSTTYGLFGQTGEVNGPSRTSTTYQLGPGLTYLLTSNVPPTPTFTNPTSSINSLQLVLAPGGNSSDTLFAIAISPDNFVSTTKYIQADDTVGNSPVWQTNTVWGASGFTVVGLTSGTTYTVKVSAKQGNFTQSAYGPTAQATTTTTTSFSFSLNSNALTFPNLNPGTVQVSTSTITATVSTSGAGGATVYAYDTNAGLQSSSTSHTIAAASADLSSTTEGYGLQTTSVGQTSGGPMEALSPYNGSANNVGILSSNKSTIFDSSGASVTSGTGTFELQAKAGYSAKPASDYADTITVIASASF